MQIPLPVSWCEWANDMAHTMPFREQAKQLMNDFHCYSCINLFAHGRRDPGL